VAKVADGTKIVAYRWVNRWLDRVVDDSGQRG